MKTKVSIGILATHEMTQLSYQIIGRGKCVESNKVFFDPSKSHTIEITPTLMMIPKAQAIFNYITSDGEIISDRIEINFGNDFINHVSEFHQCALK